MSNGVCLYASVTITSIRRDPDRLWQKFDYALAEQCATISKRRAVQATGLSISIPLLKKECDEEDLGLQWDDDVQIPRQP